MDKTTKDYFSEIFPIWKKDVKSWLGWGNWKQTMSSTVAVVGLLYFLLFGEQFDLFMDDLIHYGISGFIGLFWFFFVVFISFITANIKLLEIKKQYLQTKEGIIEAYKEKYETEPVKVNFKLTVSERYDSKSTVSSFGPFPNGLVTGTKIVGIKVSIPSGNDIECYATINSLKRYNANGIHDLINDVTQNGPLLSWSGGGANDSGEVLIKEGKDRIINVAEGINRDLIFRMQNLAFKQDENGIYIFEIEIGGHLAGKKIESKKDFFYIDFEKLDKVFTGGTEKPYGSTDINPHSTSVINSNYDQYNHGSYRKLLIKKGKPNIKQKKNMTKN